MITYTDPDYIRAKRVKLGWVELTKPFSELASWIGNYFTIAPPLYIEHAYFSLSRRPRLQVTFEYEDDALAFRDAVGNLDASKQRIVALKFAELLKYYDETATDTENMFVIFTAFEPVAREEANSRMRNPQISLFRSEIRCSEIWDIRPLFDTVAILFQTDEQLHSTKFKVVKERCHELWMKHLLAFDEFGYFKRKPAVIRFDSRENFERTYEGSWYYFWK